MPATPAVQELENLGISYRLHNYDHDPTSRAFGLEAASALGVDEAAVLKTLVVDVGAKLAVAVVPVSCELDSRALAEHLHVKRIVLAAPTDAERSTGYVVGGISPLGQRRRLQTVIDQSVESLLVCFVSAGRRGVELELAPGDLALAAGATFAQIGRLR